MDFQVNFLAIGSFGENLVNIFNEAFHNTVKCFRIILKTILEFWKYPTRHDSFDKSKMKTSAKNSASRRKISRLSLATNSYNLATIKFDRAKKQPNPSPDNWHDEINQPGRHFTRIREKIKP